VQLPDRSVRVEDGEDTSSVLELHSSADIKNPSCLKWYATLPLCRRHAYCSWMTNLHDFFTQLKHHLYERSSYVRTKFFPYFKIKLRTVTVPHQMNYPWRIFFVG
jgi:hypothetical protein